MMRLALVVPCYNEAEALPHLLQTLTTLSDSMVAEDLISEPAQIVLVDDGSTDETWQMIEDAAKTAPVQGIKLSRNHGHQAALLAGLLTAEGDVLISLDADLQDDPAAIPNMMRAHAEGAEIVFGVREDRTTDSRFKRGSARGYYTLLEQLGVDIVHDHADYRLMSRKAVDALARHDEANLFLRGIVKSLGFQTATVPYTRNERIAGESKYPLRKMLRLAVDGVTSFSTRPLRYVSFLGLGVALLALMLMAYSLFSWALGATVSGWTSLILVVLFLGAIQLIALGIIGEYLGKVFLETKRRPQFTVDRIVGGKAVDGNPAGK